MLITTTHRPRDVNAPRAAAILYGDWGTSKAYVIGLAFAIAGYASFWLILAVSILSLFVGLSYIIICKYYPNGGGVYASVRRRALANPRYEWLAVMGAFLLVADYIVTAALSALSAFYYFNVADPVLYSALFIILIACVNYLGPRHTGSFALIIAISAVAVFSGLALLSIPYLGSGWENLHAPVKDPITLWTQFCSVIVALSGVETIANTTSIMQLNRGSSMEKPVVTNTSTPSILYVMLEVVIYTTLFGLAATSIKGFIFHDQSVSIPGFSDVQNDMLGYMALLFGNDILGSTVGPFFAYALRFVVGLILLSAVNTAINGFISLQYIMASDNELPRQFLKINKFGVPLLPLIIAGLIPALLILFVRKLVLLADLYAIGFVGAIAANLGSTSSDFKLPLKRVERVFMACVFVIMLAIEITLFIQKSHARYFVLGIMLVGLALRALAKKLKAAPLPAKEIPLDVHLKADLCVVRKLSKAVKKAVADSNAHHTPLNLLFLREQKVVTDLDLKRTAENDPLAKRIFKYAHENGNPHLISLYYSVTDSFPDMAAAYALRLEAPSVIADAPHSKVLTALHGNPITQLRSHLPDEINLIVV
jgi:amino acid transporter